MPRTKNRQTAKPLANPVAIIDLTQDSPSNTALRLSRVQPRRNEEESDDDCSDGDDMVIPLDDSTEDSDGVVEDANVLQRRKKTAIVINLEDTVEEIPSAKTRAKQVVLNDSPNKKGGLSCPICFESLADENMTPMSTPCGHVYCLECLKKVTQAKKKCALCQRSITLGKCIRLHI